MSKPADKPTSPGEGLVYALLAVAAYLWFMATPSAPEPTPAEPMRSIVVEATDAPLFEQPPASTLEPPALQSPEGEPAAAETGSRADGGDGLRWYTDRSEARAAQERTGRLMLVLHKFRDPERQKACAACLKLERTLADPVVQMALRPFVLHQGYADDWQADLAPDKRWVPALSLVTLESATGDPLPLLKDFPPSPPAAFLAALRSWIDETENP